MIVTYVARHLALAGMGRTGRRRSDAGRICSVPHLFKGRVTGGALVITLTRPAEWVEDVSKKMGNKICTANRMGDAHNKILNLKKSSL